MKRIGLYNRHKLLIGIITLLLLSGTAMAQNGTVLKGRIIYANAPNGKPPATVKLQLLRDSITVKTISTDTEGYYLFENTAPGVYQLYVTDKETTNVVPHIVVCNEVEKILNVAMQAPSPKELRTKYATGSEEFKEIKTTAYDKASTSPKKGKLIPVEIAFEKPLFEKEAVASGDIKMASAVKPSAASPVKAGGNIQANLLTSGEVNDFAKWNQWDTVLTKHFQEYVTAWDYKPLHRYMAQAINQDNTPIVNALIILQDQCGNALWKARTDNTGKAELWLNLSAQDGNGSQLSIVWEYQDKKGKIMPAIEFSQGINNIKINTQCVERNDVDLFFVLDATGSMGDEMRYLQAELQDIIGKINKIRKNVNLRVGGLVYRDHGDEYLTRKQSLDADWKKTIDFFNKQSANGGGDYPEAVDEALYQVINKENWNSDALARIVFIILDAPAHEESRWRFAEQMYLAAEKGIRIVPIACSDIQKDGEYLMRCLALATNGTYLFLTDDSGIGNAHIKPTTDKYDVEKLNDAIARVVNQYTQAPDCSSSKWIEENKPFTDYDKFVPNPYDEDPSTSDASTEKMGIRDLITVHPNPCQEMLQISVKKTIQDLCLVDMSGKTLSVYHAQHVGKVEVNMQNLAAGIYFVKVFYRGKWYTEKIIKMR